MSVYIRQQLPTNPRLFTLKIIDATKIAIIRGKTSNLVGIEASCGAISKCRYPSCTCGRSKKQAPLLPDVVMGMLMSELDLNAASFSSGFSFSTGDVLVWFSEFPLNCCLSSGVCYCCLKEIKNEYKRWETAIFHFINKIYQSYTYLYVSQV